MLEEKICEQQQLSEKQKQALLDSPEITTQSIANQTEAIQKSISSLSKQSPKSTEKKNFMKFPLAIVKFVPILIFLQ